MFNIKYIYLITLIFFTFINCSCDMRNKASKIEIGRTIEPVRPADLPASAKWLKGEDGGNWFMIKKVKEEEVYEISQYFESGDFSKKLFNMKPSSFQFFTDSDYDVLVYKDNGYKLIQNQKEFIFLPMNGN